MDSVLSIKPLRRLLKNIIYHEDRTMPSRHIFREAHREKNEVLWLREFSKTSMAKLAYRVQGR